jgi:hypothetical protein
MTKNTTAKITSQHGLIYHKLLTYKGEERARDYAMANQFAIENMRRSSERCKLIVILREPRIISIPEEARCGSDRRRKPSGGSDFPGHLPERRHCPSRSRLPCDLTIRRSFIRFDFWMQLPINLPFIEKTRVTEVLSDGTILTDEGRYMPNPS